MPSSPGWAGPVPASKAVALCLTPSLRGQNEDGLPRKQVKSAVTWNMPLAHAVLGSVPQNRYE